MVEILKTMYQPHQILSIRKSVYVECGIFKKEILQCLQLTYLTDHWLNKWNIFFRTEFPNIFFWVCLLYYSLFGHSDSDWLGTFQMCIETLNWELIHLHFNGKFSNRIEFRLSDIFLFPERIRSPILSFFILCLSNAIMVGDSRDLGKLIESNEIKCCCIWENFL